MSKRLITGLLLAIIPLLAVAVWVVVDDSIRARSLRQARFLAEAESFRFLAQAQTDEELEEAVGYLGIVFRLQDGGWVAIRYRDTHSGGIWSSAVARDSGGAWFVSDEHYCGRFQIYREWRDHPVDWHEDRACESGLRALEGARLEAARDGLMALGFRRVAAPVP